jgi:hypothetical protein
MTNATAAPDREELRRLLQRWQSGEISFYQAVEEAEAIEERVWPDVEVIEFEVTDPRSIPTEIVSLLSMGYVQPLFVDDIPHLLDALDAAPGTEEQSLERLVRHFDSLDESERLTRAQELYS